MQVAILGAGGNMGRRISGALQGDDSYKLRLIEPGERGRGLLAEMGLSVVDPEPGLEGAEVVIFAVPDFIVRDVAADIVPKLDRGTSMLFLDPAAIAADRIPHRSDINCYVTHPTHPPLYSLLSETEPEARADYWGGGLARQAIVFAVAWGDAWAHFRPGGEAGHDDVRPRHALAPDNRRPDGDARARPQRDPHQRLHRHHPGGLVPCGGGRDPRRGSV